MREIKKPSDKAGNRKLEVFTVDELKKIIEYVQNEDPMWQALAFCFIDTGARRGEIVALRWSDIDLLNRRVEIFNNAQYVEGIGIYDTTPKSGKPRVIYLNEQTIAALKKWKKFQKEVVTGQNKLIPEHVFTHIDGRRISPQAPTAYFKRFGDRYEIKTAILINSDIQWQLI